MNLNESLKLNECIPGEQDVEDTPQSPQTEEMKIETKEEISNVNQESKDTITTSIHEKMQSFLSKNEQIIKAKEVEYCPWCLEENRESNHSIEDCEELGDSRLHNIHIIQAIIKHHLCFYCLQRGHALPDCPEGFDGDECNLCKKAHVIYSPLTRNLCWFLRINPHFKWPSQ